MSARFLLAGALWCLVTLVWALLPVTPGLTGRYFADREWAGPAVHEATDRTITTRVIQRRWGFATPSPFSVQWSGYLYVDRTGRYRFALAADDRARLRVDRRLVVDTEIRRSPSGGEGEIDLTAGTHEIVLQFAQEGGPYSFTWSWAHEASPLEAIPTWRLAADRHGRTALLAARVLGWAWWALSASLVWFGLAALGRVAAASAAGRSSDSPLPGERDPAHRRRRDGAAALVFFIVLAVAHTWPLASDPGRLSRNDNGDTLLNEWTIAWVAHQLPRDPLGLFDANIFHPDPRTLAFSEAMIPQALLGAPLLWLGASPVLAYNVLLMAGMALTGWALHLALYRWTGDRVAALAGGLLVAFNAHTLTRLPHLQAQHVEFLPLALIALDALLRQPRRSHAIWLAAWFTLQGLASGYLLVFSLVALSTATLARPGSWLGPLARPTIAKLALAATLSAVALTPFLVPYARVRSEQGLVRSLEEVAFFSASIGDYLTTPSRLLSSLGWQSPGTTGLFPGIAGLLLAGLAVGSGRAFTDPRARMSLAFGICGVVLSFGPFVPGYATLYDMVPLLQGTRAAVRFGYLGLLAVAILAAYGTVIVRSRLTGARRRAAGMAVVAVVALEPMAAPIAYVPFNGIPRIYEQLAEVPEAVVAELPFPPPESFHRNAPYVLNSTKHWRPLLNGYSGFVPASYVRHYLAFESFPDDAALEALAAAGVTHVVVHTDALEAMDLEALERAPGLDLIGADGPSRLYRLDRLDGPNRVTP